MFRSSLEDIYKRKTMSHNIDTYFITLYKSNNVAQLNEYEFAKTIMGIN